MWVPKALAIRAHAHLRNAGRRGLEGFTLWAGELEGEEFHVRETIIPSQTPLQLPSGVCVRVDAEELHRLNVWLFNRKLTLLAQLHSHPEEAYHSPTDDTFPIATSLGSLSLVVPNFARQPFSLARCAVYRLLQNGWTRLPPYEVEHLIRIIE